jgi:hypothetical protein
VLTAVVVGGGEITEGLCGERQPVDQGAGVVLGEL